ncbi:hypothetical protein UFOVP1307_14 [uncultured Caudovirales phage]|uniref:Uncharacterized protein n=1 Tax=uncultured Caudovirales phage TaxID=2100421 RepID=A0A6J5RV32_9CAUD|nr:hypothetical protein UFOVP651_108 [uncultured Caudovirales phage]CAB4171095.1 hypothetical protein UFOVP902_187 [uncultured Caudovirales phage]CAB4197478.1 hypothetical protein UFOVP1307_14 [uncultured Caudovirales phage]
MAEKHKSKYKKPENKKHTYRKDIKDYTMDDKDEKMNPKSAGEKLPNLLRKTDKEVIDNGSLVPKYEADDRLYKDLEDGEYDPKTALKRLTKRQDDEAKDVADVLADKIENLTREQAERIVREYVRRKIERVINEQIAPEDEEPIDPTAAPEVAPDPTAAPTVSPEAPAPAPAPTPEAPAAEPEMDAETKQAISIEKFVDQLREDGGNIARIKTLSKVFNLAMKEAEPEDLQNFYKLLRQFAVKKLATIENTPTAPEQ